MKLTGDCSIDCEKACAYPGQFSECGISVENEGGESGDQVHSGASACDLDEFGR